MKSPSFTKKSRMNSAPRDCSRSSSSASVTSAFALLSYRGFEKEGIEIIAAFDADPKRKRDKEIKQPIHGMECLPEFIRQRGVKMAIVTVPVAVVQEVVNGLVRSGITGILNFAPIMLDVPEEVSVNNVNLAIELENLSYFIQE